MFRYDGLEKVYIKSEHPLYRLVFRVSILKNSGSGIRGFLVEEGSVRVLVLYVNKIRVQGLGGLGWVRIPSKDSKRNSLMQKGSHSLIKLL